MTAVECLSKSGPYRRQVSAGALASEPLTGKNTSVGLWATCTSQFTAAQMATTGTVATMIRTANDARRSATSARPASRQAPERRARWRRVVVARDNRCEIVAYGMTDTPLDRSPNHRTRSSGRSAALTQFRQHLSEQRLHISLCLVREFGQAARLVGTCPRDFRGVTSLFGGRAQLFSRCPQPFLALSIAFSAQPLLFMAVPMPF